MAGIDTTRYPNHQEGAARAAQDDQLVAATVPAGAGRGQNREGQSKSDPSTESVFRWAWVVDRIASSTGFGRLGPWVRSVIRSARGVDRIDIRSIRDVGRRLFGRLEPWIGSVILSARAVGQRSFGRLEPSVGHVIRSARAVHRMSCSVYSSRSSAILFGRLGS